MSTSRQLTAIMFADIAGYTAIMQEDETLALRMKNKLRETLEAEITRHQGRILEFRGDGALCCFTSTLEAVRAAIALQLAMQTAPTVPLRIGMHTGDVVIEGDSIYGDGVNIASRMESFAIPGSIFISARVRDDIRNQKDVQTVSLGRFALKNVNGEMEIFAISNAGLKIPDGEKLEGKGEKLGRKCILVLPFVNMSNDPDQDYFSDGLTEELISNLGRLRDMRVISRTTSMRYKGTDKDTKMIGKETGAGYIVEGSVRKQGNNLRITAQFIDAGRDVHVWAETYRGTLDDIFDIQEKVAGKIVEALKVQLTRDEKDIFQKRYTENSEAYQLYLQGRFFWKKRNADGLKKAVRFFEKAIEKDPNYALAWAGLSDTYSLMGEYTNISRRELFPKQMAAVNKALEIDNHLAEAHVSLGISLMLNEWKWGEAEKEFLVGIDLNPNYETGHHWYAELLLFSGQTEQAFREIDWAVMLDPASPGILKDKGIYYYYSRQYDEAIRMAEKTLELDPAFMPAHRLLSLAYTGKGMFEEAIIENQRWGELTGNKVKTQVALAYIYVVSGKKEQALQIVNDPEVQNKLTSNDFRSMAMVFAALGDNDKCFEWLEKSYALHEESLCNLKVDPKMDPVRPDPRYDELLKRIGLG